MALPDVIHVTVTADDIRHGQSGSWWNDPIARSLQRQLGLGHLVESQQYVLRIFHDRHCHHYTVPSIANQFLVAFDADPQADHAPFSFELTRYIGGAFEIVDDMSTPRRA